MKLDDEPIEVFYTVLFTNPNGYKTWPVSPKPLSWDDAVEIKNNGSGRGWTGALVEWPKYLSEAGL